MPSRTRTSPHHVIESLEISGGYFGGTRIEFADGLNIVIGGQGTGKSTLLDLARFGVGAPAPDTRLQANDAMVKANLGSGRVTVWIRTKHGLRYQVSRAAGEPPRVLDEKGELVDIALGGALFKLETSGPRQMEGVATSAAQQLSLIDGFFEQARPLEDAMQLERRALERNATESVSVAHEIEVEQARVTDLASVDARLAALAEVQGPDAEATKAVYEDKTLRSRERTAAVQADDRVASSLASLTQRADEVVRALAEPLNRGVEAGPRREHWVAVARELEACAGAVRDAVASVGTRFAAAQAVIASTRRTLAAIHMKEDEAFDKLVAKHQEDRGRAAERASLLEQRAALSLAPQRLAAARREEARLRDDRAKLLGNLTVLREERFSRRAKQAAELTARLQGDQVRVSVTENGNRDAYLALLKELIGTAVKNSKLVGEIAKRIRPEDLVAAVEQSDTSTIVIIDDSKTGKEDRADRIFRALRQSGRLFELQTVGLEDAPKIELRSGDDWVPIETASNGQCFTCVLAILLLQGESPLILDEPEVHLDNEFVSKVLVPNIALARQGRQLLVITHNANIPVLGLADRIFVLDGNKRRSQVVERGTLAEVRARVEARMEGGKHAFHARADTYGYDLTEKQS